MNETKILRRILRLVIPLTPGSLNEWQRSHWAKRVRIQDAWDTEMIVALARLGQGARLVKPFERAKIRIKYYFRTKHKRDKDNFAGFKPLLDALKERVIVDDSSDRIDVNWELLYDKNRPRTEIMVEELDFER